MMKLLSALTLAASTQIIVAPVMAMGSKKPNGDSALCAQVRSQVQEGDLIFLDIDSPIFQRVARASGGWASHVGVVLLDSQSNSLIVAESTIPKVKRTNLCDFIHHSKDDHFSIKRFKARLSTRDVLIMRERADELMGTLYHTGFKFDSNRQFCSKLAWDLYQKALRVDIGRFETLAELMDNVKSTPHANGDLAFWHTWYLGRIPYKRRTLTPVSEMLDPRFYEVFYHPPKGDPALAHRVSSPTQGGGANNTAADLEVEAWEL